MAIMNIMSFNIRWCNTSAKRERLQQNLKLQMVDICLLEETKLQSIYDNVVVSLWKNKDVEWITTWSHVMSRVLLNMWNTFSLNFSFVREKFIGINVEWIGIPYYIFNVYSFYNILRKMKFGRN